MPQGFSRKLGVCAVLSELFHREKSNDTRMLLKIRFETAMEYVSIQERKVGKFTGLQVNALLKSAQSMPVGVVLRKTPGVTKWAKFVWRAVCILPGADPADWKLLRTEGGVSDYHVTTVALTIYRSDTEAYVHGLAANVPCVYVICREAHDPLRPLEVVMVTASPYEAQDYSDNGEDIVEKVMMTPQVHAWIAAYVEEHHEDEAFVKRRRDKHREHKQDGVGDARIVQATDVYRAPRRTGSEPTQ